MRMMIPTSVERAVTVTAHQKKNVAQLQEKSRLFSRCNSINVCTFFVRIEFTFPVLV
jgi:hypothetical protein